MTFTVGEFWRTPFAAVNSQPDCFHDSSAEVSEESLRSQILTIADGKGADVRGFEDRDEAL